MGRVSRSGVSRWPGVRNAEGGGGERAMRVGPWPCTQIRTPKSARPLVETFCDVFISHCSHSRIFALWYNVYPTPTVISVACSASILGEKMLLRGASDLLVKAVRRPHCRCTRERTRRESMATLETRVSWCLLVVWRLEYGKITSPDLAGVLDVPTRLALVM